MIDTNDIQNLKDVFVTRKECTENIEAQNAKITNLTIIQTKNSTKLNALIGILSTIAVPVISLCVKELFGG